MKEAEENVVRIAGNEEDSAFLRDISELVRADMMRYVRCLDAEAEADEM